MAWLASGCASGPEAEEPATAVAAGDGYRCDDGQVFAVKADAANSLVLTIDGKQFYANRIAGAAIYLTKEGYVFTPIRGGGSLTRPGGPTVTCHSYDPRRALPPPAAAPAG